jgi:hypothetical protein
MAAAQTNAQAMQQMGSDIGGALASIGDAYGEIEGNKAKGRAFKDIFKVVAPTIGMSLDQLEDVAGGKLKSDTDWYNVSQTMGPMMPALINLQLGKERVGVQKDQQQLTATLPNIRNLADNQADDAAGKTTYNPPPNLGNAVPPPSPMGFSNINQGMPGSMPAATPAPTRRPMSRRPGGS